MTRDHYKGAKKTRDAQVDSQGRLLPLEKGGGSPAVTMFNSGNLNAEGISFRADGKHVDVYVDSVNGDDLNSGLSESEALKSLVEVRKKFPMHMVEGSTTTVHLVNNTSSVVEFVTESVHYGVSEGLVASGFTYHGPDMILVTPATGPATAALDSTPAVRVDHTGAASGTEKRTRLDFTSASPGWTVDDFAGRFLRVTRAGQKVFWELPIVENGADTIYVDTINIVGTLLNTDTVEIVTPAVSIKGPVASGVVTLHGFAGTLANGGGADSQGATFTNIDFTEIYAKEAHGLRMFGCRFGTQLGYGNVFDGGNVGFSNVVALQGFILTDGNHAQHPSGLSAKAPISETAITGLLSLNTLYIGGSSNTVPRGNASFISYQPISVYGASGNAVRVQGPGSTWLTQSTLIGSGNTGVGLICRWGAFADVNGGADTTISGATGALKVDIGSAINYGTAAGEFQEAAGWNGNFSRRLEGTATAPTAFTSTITTVGHA